MRQKSILLRFVKPVNLIHKKDSALTQTQFLSRPRNNLPRLFNTRCDRAKRHKTTLRRTRNNPSQRCLTRSGRSPENHRRQAVTLNKHAKRRARPNEMILSHNIVQHLGTQAFCQWRVCHLLPGL